MAKRIDYKIIEIENFLGQLNQIRPPSLDEYKADITVKAACERFFEKIVSAVVDLAFIVVKLKKFRIPDDESDAFDILSENKVIDNKIASKLSDAKKMRNFIAHLYGKVNDEIVFHSISKELEGDVKEFIKAIKKIFK